MQIEGTQTTMSDVFEEEIKAQSTADKAAIEVQNHTKALIMGVEHLKNNDFSHDLIKELHRIMLSIVKWLRQKKKRFSFPLPTNKPRPR